MCIPESDRPCFWVGVMGDVWHHITQASSAAAKSEERVCVTGAGKSGLIACKVLTQRGVPFDCFEEGSQVQALRMPACWSQHCRCIPQQLVALGMGVLTALWTGLQGQSRP